MNIEFSKAKNFVKNSTCVKICALFVSSLLKISEVLNIPCWAGSNSPAPPAFGLLYEGAIGQPR